MRHPDCLTWQDPQLLGDAVRFPEAREARCRHVRLYTNNFSGIACRNAGQG